MGQDKPVKDSKSATYWVSCDKLSLHVDVQGRGSIPYISVMTDNVHQRILKMFPACYATYVAGRSISW